MSGREDGANISKGRKQKKRPIRRGVAKSEQKFGVNWALSLRLV